ncbi:hypothetical protein BH23CHL2_BH23CHL2_24310 [soil metagenome]
MKQYVIVIEKGETNSSGYVPDLPVCFTVGDSPDEVEANLRDAIAAHVQALLDFGMPVPEPSFESPVDESDTEARLVEVAVS